MAKNKNKFSMTTEMFDYAYEIDKLYGREALLETATIAVNSCKELVNREVSKALKESKYSFKAGTKYSQGETRKSFGEVYQIPTRVVGSSVVAFAGIDAKQAPQAVILALEGAPNKKRDVKLANAIFCKGKVLKVVQTTMMTAFIEGLKDRK